jgi:hypothetical protein
MSIITGVGSPGTVSSASGGYTYAYNNIGSSASEIILPTDPARKQITFHNPGTIDIFVAPLTAQNTGSDVGLTVGPTQLGGSFLVFANGGTLIITGECQKQWQAFSRTGSNNPLTITVTHV